MELILIYFFIKVKAKSAEIGIGHKGISYPTLLFFCWLAGEILGIVVGCKISSSWLIRYLIGAGCGIGAGWLVYRKVMSLEQRYPDYFDLRQSKPYPYFEAEAEPAPRKTNYGESIIEKKEKQKTIPVSIPASSEPDTGYIETGRTVLKPEMNPDYYVEIQPEMKPEYQAEIQPDHTVKLQPEIKTEDKKEVKLGLWSEFRTEIKPGPEYHEDTRQKLAPGYQATPKRDYIPQTNIGFKTPNETVSETAATGSRHIFQFPYSELLSINELVLGEYGVQTVVDHAIANSPWFEGFKTNYANRDFQAAAMALENALYEDRNDGLVWLLFGILYKDGYHDHDKALQFCLSGAKRCNSYKIALLTEAAELLLLGRKDILNGFKFFCLAIIAITDLSKAWGNPGINGCVAQERAFHFIRVLLTAYNFHDYRLYLERNIKFSTGLDQALIEKVLAIATESPFHTEIEQRIPQLFPAIIEKVQALG